MIRPLIPKAIQMIARSESVAGEKGGIFYPYHCTADAAGVLTIYRGHVIKPGEEWMKAGISERQGEEIFAQDVANHCQFIESDLGSKPDDWQFGAFGSFAFNLGARIFATGGIGGQPPLFTQFWKGGQHDAAIYQMYKFCNSGGQYQDGLFYRRITEIAFAKMRALVDQPHDCETAKALMDQIDPAGGALTSCRKYFNVRHRKEKCTFCTKAAP